MKKNLLWSEKSISKQKKYFDHDDIEYRGITDVKNLFDLSIEEDHYKPIKTNDTFKSNYIEYESEGEKSKTLSIKEYLHLIITYLPLFMMGIFGAAHGAGRGGWGGGSKSPPLPKIFYTYPTMMKLGSKN